MLLCQVLLLFTFHTVTALPTSPILHRSRRIVGGDPAFITQVPYLVNIRKNGYFHCGGSLISSRCVLTAAHCVRNAVPNDFIVRGGVTLLNDVENKRFVERFFVPAEYNNITFEHDFSILRLKTKLQGASIKPILLGDAPPLPGDFIQVSGWGLTHENAVFPPNRMQTVYLRVFEQEECKAFYEAYRNVTETMFCASVPGEKDACLADSGGPAVLGDRLVGVVSWGKKNECGHADSPGVYVNLNKVKNWIMDILYTYC
ncbi:hypodermin-B [Eurosta solidaginis]|uniref:hypodermin-B n=1 Tax=Eurosta solidaginis TaxID=178769 RepID=UPI0035315579